MQHGRNFSLEVKEVPKFFLKKKCNPEESLEKTFSESEKSTKNSDHPESEEATTKNKDLKSEYSPMMMEDPEPDSKKKKNPETEESPKNDEYTEPVEFPKPCKDHEKECTNVQKPPKKNEVSKLKESQTGYTIPFQGTQVVCVQRKVFIGGDTDWILVYDCDANSCKRFSSPDKCKNYTLVEYQNQLVLLGGTIDGKKVYVRTSDNWNDRQIKPMQIARENATAVGHIDYIVVFGGLSHTKVFYTSLKHIEVYNGINHTWELVGYLPYSGYLIQKYVSNDKFLFILDHDGRKIQYCALDRLVKCNCEWKSVDRKIHHKYSSLCVIDDALFAFTGASSDGNVYTFESDSGKWKRVIYSGSARLPAITNANCVPLDDSNRELFICGRDSDIMGRPCKEAYIVSIKENSNQVETSE